MTNKELDELMYKKLNEYKENLDINLNADKIIKTGKKVKKRKLIIKTKGNEYKVTMTFKEMLNSLDNRFVQCYRSCIVNKDRVRKIDYKEGYFELDTGDKIYMVSEKMCRDKILLWWSCWFYLYVVWFHYLE